MKTIFTPFLICIILAVSAPAFADSASISKKQAVSIAQQVSPGKVLSVKLKGSTYQVKTLNSKGEVRVISINANNGKVSGR